MKLMDRYYDAMMEVVNKAKTTQRENILKAGKAIADSVANGGCVHLGEVVHGADMDLIYRGGGPLFFKHFTYDLAVGDPVRDRDRSDMDTNMEGLGKYIIKQSKMRPGDVLIVSSVSGRTARVVDLAYEAVRMGITVIAFTSMEYATTVEPIHSSGKKLYEIASIVIDNCAPAAEAMLDVEGIEAKFGACSGISSDFLLWFIASTAVEELLAKGITPGILKSANFPGGADYNHQVVEPNYQKYGW